MVDWKFRYEMLRTAEVAGGTKKEKGMRHYKIAEMFMVGEATGKQPPIKDIVHPKAVSIMVINCMLSVA